MEKDDLVLEIGRMLVQDPHISSRPWSHLVIVAQMFDDSTKVNGFAYQDNGKALPTGPKNFDVLTRFEDLREAMKEPSRNSWRACLIRIDQPSGNLTADFEYDQPDKWLITPATVRQMAEQLRPKLN